MVEHLATRGPDSRARQERYGLLLGATLAAFFIQGVATPERWEEVLLTALLAMTLMLALWAADARPQVTRAASVVAVAVVAFSISEAISGDVNGAAPRIANLLLVVLAPPVVVLGVFRSLRMHSGVTVEAVFGVLCLYILVGMLFALTYGAIDRLGHEFFASNAPATPSNCLYFSFTTLTTVGYGDLVAKTNLGHTLSVSEALLGQIYLVTVVSVFVSNLRRREPARPQ
ncbi:MAG TPA: potassium channel family protein [Solirubrobacteraceae bacterium]|nr:potassium channel family protein [Solirubrobacteraceae bacterium]